MNILFVSTENPYPPDHGHHIRTYNVLKGLAENNTIYFVGFAKNKAELKHKAAIEPLCASVDLFLIASGWRFYLSLFFNMFSSRPFITARYYKREAREKIREILSKREIDLAHVDLLHVSRFHRDLRSVPKVLVNHNVESLRFFRRLKTESSILKKLYFYLQYYKLRRYESQITRQFDCCVVVSDTDQQVIAGLSGSHNFAVLPNGVDVEYFKANGTIPEPHSLIWVGSMLSPYNADAVDYFLRDILPEIKKEIADLKVGFVGAAPTKLLRDKAARDPNLRIHGYVEDVRPYMEQASVFIAPMRSGSGTKIKVLNALAMRMPVVTTPVGAEGIEAVAGESILIAEDALDFANKTITLLRDASLAEKLASNGRKVVEKFYDWKVIHAKTEELYSNLTKTWATTGSDSDLFSEG
ncbi:MAG: glycosyltransferase family 4 protein [bacterium]